MSVSKAEFPALMAKAKAAGMAAGEAVRPTPMTVTGGVPGEAPKSWYVSEGMCGFAWVNVKPGTSSFAKWLKASGNARSDSYYGGVTIWISAHGQSVDRKEAHAKALAAVLTEAGFRATWNSRLD